MKIGYQVIVRGKPATCYSNRDEAYRAARLCGGTVRCIVTAI